MDTEDCPIAVDTGSLTPDHADRPRVVGKRGSGPGKIFNHTVLSYIFIVSRTNVLWGYYGLVVITPCPQIILCIMDCFYIVYVRLI